MATARAEAAQVREKEGEDKTFWKLKSKEII